MPPKTRGGKISKASKENPNPFVENPKRKLKTGKVTKPRKALADKTNSASDDNASVLPSKPSKNGEQDIYLVNKRPRRDRRLPTRYVESNVLQNLSNSKNASIENEPIEPVRIPIVLISPLKTKKSLNDSLIASRPKRICRLPSKFEDHSVSPSKFVPVQPTYASTPKIQKKVDNNRKDVSPKLTPVSNKVISTKVNRRAAQKINNNGSNSSADTNNNAKKDLPRTKNITKRIAIKSPSPKVSPFTSTNNKLASPTKSTNNKLTSPAKSTNKNLASPAKSTNNKLASPTKSTNKKLASPVKLTNKKFASPTKSANNKLIGKNTSITILEDRKSSKRNASNIDVYEFTYDPNEEPPPQKKKRKRPAKKREPKPKNVVFKNNYDVNVAKALAALKNKVATNSTKPVETDNGNVPASSATTQIKINAETNSIQTNIHIPSSEVNTQTTSNNPIVKEVTICNDKSHVSQKNYNSVRVEDIALDFEDSCADDINYSPVNSPCRPITPAPQNVDREKERPNNADPLNLREDFSFFDDNPVASSSMNVSVRHPAASPWRAEFGSLPIKWQVNTYVKANMTPAYESSFINFNDSKKKHVYTNMGVDTNEDAPQIYEDNTSKLKQTSIISFIKECVEKSAKKKKKTLTPIKTNSLFEDLNNTSVITDGHEKVTPKKTSQNKTTNENVTPPDQDISCNTSNECSGENSGSNKDSSTEKVRSSSKKKKDKNVTYFGFDDSENHDQENVSPTKKLDKRRLRALKPRARAVLQEINSVKEPTRLALPAAIKSKITQSSDTVNKLFDQMKSAAEPPVFPEKEPTQTETTNITEVQVNEDTIDDDADSVHLFEDIEVVHHLKAHRKSYGKAKKAVTFRRNSMSDSDVPTSEVAEQSASSDEDDLHDLTFKMPELEPKKTVKKKKTKKQKLSKKEEQEVEAWAAGFNSMCEDIEEFDLVVE